MIKLKTDSRNEETTVTFSLDENRPVSVVGDFNGWDPWATPLKKRSNGRKSAVVKVPAGTELRFRYLADGGEYYDDPDAELEPNGFGGVHGRVVATA
ncbi:MAG: isoamylase early set domain-containing protein [Acidimicrobiales bacterium]|nr:isoamylase early set domain-containing protein [Acidimicrobiales bacterium]